MPPKSSDSDNVVFLLQCLASACENSGKIDLKTIGATHHNGATQNALYLRLNRLKKSVNFTETAATTPATSAQPSAEDDDAATADAATEKPYAPTASLPAPQAKPKRAAGAAKGSKKRKAEVDYVDGSADGVGPAFTAVNGPVATTAKPVKKAKHEEPSAADENDGCGGTARPELEKKGNREKTTRKGKGADEAAQDAVAVAVVPYGGEGDVVA